MDIMPLWQRVEKAARVEVVRAEAVTVIPTIPAGLGTRQALAGATKRSSIACAWREIRQAPLVSHQRLLNLPSFKEVSMAPIRPQDHAFVFESSVLVELRSKLGLNQAGLAELLDVPVNTLSRWERGSNVPDANALAALFSVAVERGITPEFFKERRSAIMNNRDKDAIFIQWDYQNASISHDDVRVFSSDLWDYTRMMFRGVGMARAVAYVSQVSQDVDSALTRKGFEITHSFYNSDRELIGEGEAYFGLSPGNDRHSIDPSRAVYVLISNDGGYAEYLGRLKNAGIEVFVCGTTGCSERLIKTVGHDRFIPFQRPYFMWKCYLVARRLLDKSVTKGAFGNQCRVAIEEDGWEGKSYQKLLKDAGFSLNRPFASALQHMNTMGILRVKQADDDPNRVTLTIPRN